MIQGTFFQKLLLSIICGAVFAGMIQFYKHFIEGADQALNGKQTWGAPAKR